MAINVYGPRAKPREPVDAGDFGRGHPKVYSIELAALGQNEVAALGKIPAGSIVVDLRYNTDALGANTAIQFGYEAVDGSPASANYFATASDTSSAANGRTSAFALNVTEDLYITAKNTGSGDATGTVEVIVTYVYIGNA